MSGRRLSHLNFKGPIFRSYQTARLDTSEKMQWLPHDSTRAQLRHLRQKCRSLLDSNDPQIKALGQRTIAAVQHEPNPEFGALHLMSAALDASSDTGESWITTMTYLLDKFEEKERNGE